MKYFFIVIILMFGNAMGWYANNLQFFIDYWKDKPIFIAQAKKWSLSKIRFVMKKTYDLEITIKSNSNISPNLLMKKLLIDICEIANA